MNRYFASINTTRVALKQLSHIVPIELTKIQEKFASIIGYQTWKEFINVNKETKESSWITHNELSNIIENLFDKKIIKQDYYQIRAVISKIFLIDIFFLKDVYKKIPDKEFFFLRNSLFTQYANEPHIINITSPIILDRENDNLFNMKSSIIRCFDNIYSDFQEDYIYINSSVILPNMKDIILNGLRSGISYYVLNYTYDESIIREFMRLLFSGNTLIFSGPDSYLYKDKITNEINEWNKGNYDS